MSDPWNDPSMEEFLTRAEAELVPMLRDSAVSATLVPTSEPDLKIAIELGLSILFDKPLILLVRPGTPVSAHLARAADAQVEFDPDDAKGTETRLLETLRRIMPDQAQ